MRTPGFAGRASMHLSGHRKLVAVGIAGLAAVSSWGVYATTLTISDRSSFAAGTQTLTAGCDTDGVTTFANPVWESETGTWAITNVQVDEIAAACLGQTVTVMALDANHDVLAGGQASEVLTSLMESNGGYWADITFDNPLSVDTTTGVHSWAVVIKAGGVS